MFMGEKAHTYQYCYHCGNTCDDKPEKLEEKLFCCMGCKTVYELLSSCDMDNYYDLENHPGISPENFRNDVFAYLESEEIKESLLEFSGDGVEVIQWFLPEIHCSSCIWLLENLNRLREGIKTAQVNFPKKNIRIVYEPDKISMRELAELLAGIGYKPEINLSDTEEKKNSSNKSLLYKLGIAGFSFGNTMFVSLPEYLTGDWMDPALKELFGYMSLLLAIPVFFYSGQEYLISAWKGIRQRFINIDVPVALGLLVLFVRSSYEIISGTGSGYFDSLSGLVFFLLLGKFFQKKTYDSLSFERDYKSYFPVAVTRLRGNEEENVVVKELKKGDRILIRNEELIPADSILIRGKATIDNSFVTGESRPIEKHSGDRIYAGGRQLGEAIELEVIKEVSQSYLTQLWNHDVFQKNKEEGVHNITDAISKYFTLVILIIAFAAAAYWYMESMRTAVQVFTAILIVACPCALALSAPFTLGNALRIFGRNGFYIKNADVIEHLAAVDTIVFDKTGTMTVAHGEKIMTHGAPLTDTAVIGMRSLLRQSNHPLSRMLYDHFSGQELEEVQHFQELAGKGIEGEVRGRFYSIGSADFAGHQVSGDPSETRVYLSIDHKPMAYFSFHNQYRAGLEDLMGDLKQSYRLSVTSGDNDGERTYLKDLLGKDTHLMFQQKPEDKLHYIQRLIEGGANVAMLGDGLNDAGALKRSDVGISISENVNAFSPASDAILDASAFGKLSKFMLYAKHCMKIIHISFVVSFLYNLVGLYFAVTASLSPVVAAILMPLSSISVVALVSFLTNFSAAKRKL